MKNVEILWHDMTMNRSDVPDTDRDVLVFDGFNHYVAYREHNENNGIFGWWLAGEEQFLGHDDDIKAWSDFEKFEEDE